MDNPYIQLNLSGFIWIDIMDSPLEPKETSLLLKPLQMFCLNSYFTTSVHNTYKKKGDESNPQSTQVLFEFFRQHNLL